jgi:hypothetical protein
MPRSTTTYVVAGVIAVLIVLGTGLKFSAIQKVDPKNGNSTGRSSQHAEPTHSREKSVPSPSSPVSLVPSVVAGLDQTQTVPPIASGPSASALSPQNGAQSQDPSPKDVDSSNPASVIGRPFLISASVEDRCKRLKQEGRNGETECDWIYPFVTELAKEPRDPQWAPRAEAMLKGLLLAEPDKYTIRNLECRTSICVVEYSSMLHQDLHPSYEFERDAGLNEEMRAFAFETDPMGARLAVTVLPFTRKQ